MRHGAARLGYDRAAIIGRQRRDQSAVGPDRRFAAEPPDMITPFSSGPTDAGLTRRAHIWKITCSIRAALIGISIDLEASGER